MDPNQPSVLPWYVAALWGVIIVVGSYALLMIFASIFLRSGRRWNRKPLPPFRVLDKNKQAEIKAGAHATERGE